MRQTLDRFRTAILTVMALSWALPLSAAGTETPSPTPVPGPTLQFSYGLAPCGGPCSPPYEAYEAQASTYIRYVDPSQPFGADLDSMDRIELFIDGALVSTESGGYSLPNMVGTIGDGHADLLVGCHTYQKVAYTTGGLSTASPAQLICLGTPTITPTTTPTQSPSGASATPTYTVSATRTPGPPVNFTKSLVAGDGSAGSQATYIIDLAVGGSTGAMLSTIWDTLPANTSFLSSNPAPASVSGNVLSWFFGVVLSGSHQSITVVVSVNSAGDLCNQASYYSDHVFPAGLRTSGLACVGAPTSTLTSTPSPTPSTTAVPAPGGDSDTHPLSFTAQVTGAWCAGAAVDLAFYLCNTNIFSIQPGRFYVVLEDVLLRGPESCNMAPNGDPGQWMLTNDSGVVNPPDHVATWGSSPFNGGYNANITAANLCRPFNFSTVLPPDLVPGRDYRIVLKSTSNYYGQTGVNCDRFSVPFLAGCSPLSPTLTPTPVAGTATATRTNTLTVTRTVTASHTRTVTPTVTPTLSPPPTLTDTPSPSPTPGSPSCAPVLQSGCVCSTVYIPVCGCDGNTYPSACNAACFGITAYTAGPCGGTLTRTPTTGPILLVDEGRVRIYPSPARGDRAWLAVNLPQAGKARLVVLDGRMRPVVNMEVGVPAGPYAVPIDIRGLRRGVYFYRAVLTLGDGTVLRPASGRFTVLR